jgi:hypothetical protein
VSDFPVDPRRFATLVDWIDGRLSPEHADAVAAEVAQSDARTQAIVDWLRSFVSVGRRLPLEEPPPIVRQRLNSYFEQWWDKDQQLHQEIAAFDADILYDSRTAPVLAGARGTVTDSVLHLAYSTDAADLVLDVQRLVGHRVRIDGQVLVSGDSARPVFEATISGPGFTLRTVDGDVLGRFRLDDVPDTAERLVVSNGEITVTARLELRVDGP